MNVIHVRGTPRTSELDNLCFYYALWWVQNSDPYIIKEETTILYCISFYNRLGAGPIRIWKEATEHSFG